MQGAAKLGHPVTAKRTRMVDPKHPMLVAVKCDRLAPGLQIGTGRLEIGKETLWGERRGQGTIVALRTDGVSHATVE